MTAAPNRIALVQASWHRDVTDPGRDAFVTEIANSGVDAEHVDLFTVPGSFEIPLHAQRLAASGRYAAIVALGLVVDGGIYRHEFVASAVVDGLMRVQLDTGVPVFSVVLTPHLFHENSVHPRFFSEHFVLKGAEAARACADTLASLARLPQTVG